MRSIETNRVEILGRDLEISRIAPVRSGLATLVFLHEGLGSIALWRDFPAGLAERTGCGAIVYSRYGNGFSAPLAEARTPRYMHDEALLVLPALLAALGIDDAVLVGHSDGASIALIYAGERPAALRALVLEAPHLFVEDLSVRSIASIKGEFETTALPERMARYHADARRTFYGWNDIWLSPQFRDWNIEDAVARVQAPLLAIQGADDEYGTLAQLNVLAERAPAPVDRIVLACCGHAPHRDRSVFVEEAVTAWLAPLAPLTRLS